MEAMLQDSDALRTAWPFLLTASDEVLSVISDLKKLHDAPLSLVALRPAILAGLLASDAPGTALPWRSSIDVWRKVKRDPDNISKNPKA